MIVVPGMGHGMGGEYGSRRMQDFFVRHLLGQQLPDHNSATSSPIAKTPAGGVTASAGQPPNGASLTSDPVDSKQAVDGRASTATWPRPIPCRSHVEKQDDLFVMTLGDVQTELSNGTFDPQKDELRLTDGKVVEHYYRDQLGIKYFAPLDKKRFPLPPTGWCTWYYYYPKITAAEVKQNAQWIADNLREFGANTCRSTTAGKAPAAPKENAIGPWSIPNVSPTAWRSWRRTSARSA